MKRNLFEGKLVRLRAYEPEDREMMYRQLQDSEISRCDSEIKWPYARSHVYRNIERMNENPHADDRSLAIETLDGRLIGGLSVYHCDTQNGTFGIGLGIADRTEWGKGYATEAMLLALRFVFHELRYQKCNLGVYAFNTRALRLYQRLGFVEEGCIRRNYYTGGQYHDEIQMGMTREEFDALYPEWNVFDPDEYS